MSTATLTPVDTNRIPRINETAPDFTAETTQGTIRFHEWIGTDGRFCFRIRRTSRPYAPPNSDTMAAYSRNLLSATPKLLA